MLLKGKINSNDQNWHGSTVFWIKYDTLVQLLISLICIVVIIFNLSIVESILSKIQFCFFVLNLKFPYVFIKLTLLQFKTLTLNQISKSETANSGYNSRSF